MLVTRSRIFYPEDGGDMFLGNIGSHKIYMAPHPRRQRSSVSWTFTMQLEMVLLNEHNSETLDGVTAAGSHVCVMVLKAEIYHTVQGHYHLE
jgi:hypothetical protein